MKLMMSKGDSVNSFGKKSIRSNVKRFRMRIREMLKKGEYDYLPVKVKIGYRD